MVVTSPARAVPTARLREGRNRSSCFSTSQILVRPAGTPIMFCQLGRLRRQAVVVLYSAKHRQRDQLAAPAWRCDQLRVRLRYRMQRL